MVNSVRLPKLPRFVAPLLTGLLLSLAMPGRFGWWPLAFVALVPLLQSALDLPPRRSCLHGLAAGFLYHLALLYWIIIVLGRYGGIPLFLSLPALLLLALYMGLYMGVFCGLVGLLVGKYWDHERSAMPLLVWSAPIVWVGLEWLRGRLFTGLPWMDLGYALYRQTRLIQAADLGGHHLLSFCIVMANALIVGMISGGKHGSQGRPLCTGGRRVVLFACCALVFTVGYSFTRYRQVEMGMRRCLRAGITVVQGNIAQDAKWTGAWRQKTVDTYLDLSSRALERNITELVVWPETALPFYPSRNPLFDDVVHLAVSKNIFLITGSPWIETDGSTKGEAAAARYYNSALLVTPQGRLGGRLDKRHLVPFGEYVPLRRYLPFFEPLVESVGDFTAGKPAPPLTAGSIRAGTLICFESIFPDIARSFTAEGANLLVGITNDAWYGRSSAPVQSLAMSVLRAVENRRGLVRAANTGISAIVDPLGNLRHETRLFETAFLSATLPLMTEKTLFVRFGHHFGAVCFSLILPLLLCRRAMS